MDAKDRVLKMIELDGRSNFLNGQVAEKVAEIEKAGKCLSYLETARRNLAEAAKLEAIDDLATAFAGQLDRVTQLKADAEKEKVDIITETDKIQSQIETLRDELKAAGIQLTIGSPRTPKTSVV
jgi:hypothetical protein